MNCPKCNSPVKDNHTFCGNCGYKLDSAYAQPVETPRVTASPSPAKQASPEQMSPADAKAINLLTRGVEFHFKGNLKQALKLFRQAEKIAPHRPDVHENIGNIYRDMPDFKKAIEYYNRSIEIDPENPSAYTNRGVTYMLNGHTGKAMDDFNRALVLEPSDTYALFSRAGLYIDGGNLDAALDDLNLLIQIDPEFGQAYLNRGFIFQQRNDFPAAAADYRKAILLITDPEALRDAQALLKQVTS